MRALALSLALALQIGAALAVTPNEMLKDPALEARARALSQQLRCMVCQNQSIDDSEAPLAHDLRVLVRERLNVGDTDQQVIDFLVSRYGKFVLLKPRFEWHTALLWVMPPAILIVGSIALVIFAGRRREQQKPEELSADEQTKLATLVQTLDDRRP